MHWPGVAKLDARSPLNAQLRRETWQVLEAYQRQGRFRAIGVSNYTVEHLRELLEYAQVGRCTWSAHLHIDMFTGAHYYVHRFTLICSHVQAMNRGAHQQ